MARTAPQSPSDSLAVSIKINGVLVGSINPDTLNAGAQLDLEDAKGLRDVIRWLETHAGADRAEAEAALRPVKLRELPDVMKGIGEALRRAIDIPN